MSISYPVAVQYVNILDATLSWHKYTAKEFFNRIQEEHLDINPDDVLAHLDKFPYPEDVEKLINEAKVSLYGFRAEVANEADVISIEKSHVIADKAKDTVDTVGRFVDDAIDGVRYGALKVRTGYIKHDIKEFKDKTSEAIKNFGKKKEEKTEEEALDVTDKTVIKDVKPVTPLYMFDKVPGAVPFDIQHNIDVICGLIVDRVQSGTKITVVYNYEKGYYTANIEFEGGATNILGIDVGNMIDGVGIQFDDEKYGTLTVPFKEDEIAMKLITTPMYKLTEKETKSIIKKYYFEDIGLYHTYDFSTLRGIGCMSKRDKKKFEKVLSRVANNLMDVNTKETPRFRFTNYIDPENFSIASDAKCKSPLAYKGETSSWIVNMSFDIKGGVVIGSLNNNNPVDQSNSFAQQVVA